MPTFNTPTERLFELDTRNLIEGGGRDALDDGLAAPCEHGGMRDVELLCRRGETALTRSRIGRTTS